MFAEIDVYEFPHHGSGEEPPGDSQIRFPVALEKALDLKSERAKEIGANEEQLLGNVISKYF